jgi:hypothetical protein
MAHNSCIPTIFVHYSIQTQHKPVQQILIYIFFKKIKCNKAFGPGSTLLSTANISTIYRIANKNYHLL